MPVHMRPVAPCALVGGIQVPVGVAMFPCEIYYAPKEWCAQAYNLKRYTTFESGGHFAALEEPEALVADILAFFVGDLGLGTALHGGVQPKSKL